MHGVQAVVLLKELNRQPLKYMLDIQTNKCIIIIVNFQVTNGLHGGPESSYNYTINYLIITS